MTSQEIDDDIIRNAEHISAAKQEDYRIGEPESSGEGLMVVLEPLPSYFQERARKDDLETLLFCLQHLCYHVDSLYSITLPDLTILTRETASSGILAHRHHMWTQLQEMLHQLERIESLCHLLLAVTTSLLAILGTISTRESEGELSSPIGMEQWQQAYETLTTRLKAWQQQDEERLSFASTFSAVKATLTDPILTGMDNALTLLLDSASAIFGDIIPDFQVVSQGDDEVAATLLFDLMQQADLLLMHTSTLVEPLQELIKPYAIGE